MCGRMYVPEIAEVERVFSAGARNPRPVFKEIFNVAPTLKVPVVVAVEGAREVAMMRWGLIPFFAKGVAGAYSSHLARIETFKTSPAYRGAWKKGQRCIVPMKGFYEWHLNDDGGKQPFFIHVTNGSTGTFGVAGIWDRSITDAGDAIETFAVITMPASPKLAQVHNDKQRQPAILQEQDWDTWLNGTVEAAGEVLKHYPDEHIDAWPVSTRVNSTKNNDAKLLDPIV